MKHFILVWVVVFNTSVIVANATQSLTLQDLAFLSGSWQQQKNGQLIEVHWSQVAGDSMVGNWRTIKGENLLAYEALTMVSDDNADIIYRYDLHTHQDEFQSARSSYFRLLSVADRRAEFASMDESQPQWRLVIEISKNGNLKGSQYDVTGEDPTVYIGYDAAPMINN